MYLLKSGMGLEYLSAVIPEVCNKFKNMLFCLWCSGESLQDSKVSFNALRKCEIERVLMCRSDWMVRCQGPNI